MNKYNVVSVITIVVMFIIIFFLLYLVIYYQYKYNRIRSRTIGKKKNIHRKHDPVDININISKNNV